MKKVAPFAATCAVAVVVAVVVIGVGRGGDAAGGGGFEARIPPVEFLYLDGARILNFLAELEGGEVGAVHRISKKIENLKVGASASGFEVGASSQHEDSAESTLTRTESSELGLLLAGLEDDEWKGVDYHVVDLEKPEDLDEVREGMLVKFVTHFLLSPGYIRPYVVIRQSATLAALFPRAPGNEADAERFKEQRRKAESFARQVGPDPRVTFEVEPPADGPGKGLTLLLPMHYSGLTSERSLLEKGPDEYTGGRLVVVGKVIREFDHPTEVEPRCGTAAPCLAGPGPEYTDFATREIWRNPLKEASSYLIDHVSHNCEIRQSAAAGATGQASSKPVRGRRCFLDKLDRQTSLYAPGAVVLPIAIYK
jgi:hypothetical protein